MLSDALITVVKVSRPAGWSFGPILFAIGLIHSPSRLRERPKAILLQLLSLSFPLALVVFGVNDVYDYASDMRNPRKVADALEGTVLAPALHDIVMLSAWVATAFILAASIMIARPSNTIVVVALLTLSWQYSALPFRFKERPVLDSFSNGAIVDLAYLTGYTAGGGRLDREMLRLRGHVLALCTTAAHALGAAVDVEADAAAGQRTIATALGPRLAIAFGAANYLAAFAVERAFTVFGIYILGGLCILIAPLFDLDWAHLAFRSVVYWTITMATIWFAEKALTIIRGAPNPKRVD